ncbi:helix-turn-helix transcriptional regulator [Brevibacillus humidisoli]|uniref:winged helix-turn-helix transcriptional regulator n=1 Tax=Brevibacillus humidisoli TaxID=2895522 RepID=UPI001E639E44|nr:helix-turn-helix domain-containing protein [Brevibacillus humidisoli]UFJ42562.1 helix-turn-helix transcriptional regulator [Brevibacillus humidisoli]
MSKTYNLPCNIACTLDLIGDRWTLLIIRELLFGKTKFNELKQSLPGIAPNLLSDRLQMLEREGLVASILYHSHPPRYRYELTQIGKDLQHVLHALAIWGNRYLEPKHYELVHSTCQHKVTISCYCPHCDAMTDDVTYVPVTDQTESKRGTG